MAPDVLALTYFMLFLVNAQRLGLTRFALDVASSTPHFLEPISKSRASSYLELVFQ
jgi:hypothetical protein